MNPNPPLGVLSGRWLVAGTCATVAAVGLLAWRWGWSPALPAFAILAGVGSAVAIVDGQTHRVPDLLVLPALPFVAGLLALAAAVEDQWWPLVRSAAGAGLMGAFFSVLAVSYPERDGRAQVGMGDIKLATLLGFGLGWLGWSTLSTAVMAALALCSVSIVWRRWRRRPANNGWLPFAGSLCLGAYVAALACR